MTRRKPAAGLVAIDVGGGTQDILVYLEGEPIENCPKMVLPSPTRIVAAKIAAATRAGKPVFLFGETMGGGSCTKAAREHLAAGYSLFAAPRAALTFHDDIRKVEQMGVVVAEEPPADAVRIRSGDVDKRALAKLLRQYSVELPAAWAVAVQDHGFAPGKSNRQARFDWFREFIESDGNLDDLAFENVPPLFTRMLAVRNELAGAVLMDTGPAAVLGALQDETVRRHEQQAGAIIANAGNYHVMCALVRKGRVLGLLEHHTGMLNRADLADIVERFRTGRISHEEILHGGGHGSHISAEYRAAEPIRFLAVTGPRRHLFDLGKAHAAVPHGDMMLTGCFGLVEAARKRGVLAR